MWICLGLGLGINSKAFRDENTLIYGDLSKTHGYMRGQRKYILIRTSAHKVGLSEKNAESVELKLISNMTVPCPSFRDK